MKRARLKTILECSLSLTHCKLSATTSRLASSPCYSTTTILTNVTLKCPLHLVILRTFTTYSQGFPVLVYCAADKPWIRKGNRCRQIPSTFDNVRTTRWFVKISTARVAQTRRSLVFSSDTFRDPGLHNANTLFENLHISYTKSREKSNSRSLNNQQF